jgi:hypothetical protein
MTSIEMIEKAVNSKVVEKAYDDAGSKPAKQVGELVEDVIKTIRLLGFPFQVMAEAQDRFRNMLESALNRIPQERRINPQLQIVGPIYEHIKYIDDNIILYQMFEELLARSFDSERIAEAHPSFIHIISQLSHDEAIILLELRNNDFDFIESFNIDSETHRSVNRIIEKCNLPKERLLFPDNVEINIDHLVSLGLALFPQIKKDIFRDVHLQEGSRNYFKIHLTDFGRFFIKACLPEGGFRNK